MKKYFKFLTICYLAVVVFTACSSEDLENKSETPQNAAQIQFSFTEEDFDSDEEMTRAANSEDASHVTKDFGNNLETDFSIERDTTRTEQERKLSTRAIANAHYTIRAYQGTTLKDEMRGTFNGNTFTPDADSKDVMGLAAGTYDFIAFNDKVTPTATGFTVTQANVATAFIGKIKNRAISGKEMKIAFLMKHVGCRVRVKVNRYARKIDYRLFDDPGKFYSTTSVPETVALDYMGENPIVTATRPFSYEYPVALGSVYDYSPEQDARMGNEWVYSAKSQWQYFLPGTVLSNFKIDLPAYTIYKKNAPAATYSLPKAVRYNLGTKIMIDFKAVSNASYSAKIRLVYTGYKYLFKDGSVGTLKSVIDPTTGWPTKQAVGFVIKENDGTPHSGIAMLLRDAEPGMGSAAADFPYANSGYYPGTSSTLPTAWNEMDGYDKCYGTSGYYSVRNTLAKQVAERQRHVVYPIDTPPASFSEFYVPSVGEWKAFFDVLGFGDAGVYTSASSLGGVGSDNEVDPVLASYASTAYCYQNTETGKYSWSGVDSEPNTFMSSKSYWTCTEYNSYSLSSAPFRVFFNDQGSQGISFGAFRESLGANPFTDTKARLRAFVHF